MKKTFLIVSLLALAGLSSFSQQKIWDETPEQKTERMQWWTDARFGMFIHWGIYALPARHEWVKNRERLTTGEYQKYFDAFNPDLYDPHKWAVMAREAGMKYAVITSKHHDGFCLFDSRYTDYDAVNTPYGKDLLREWVEAFRAEGLGVGFYYSLIDWHHPDFTVDRVHPQRTDDPEERARLNEGRDMSVYREYLKNQIRELLTNYGKIDVLWLDFSYPGENGKGRDDWGAVELMQMIRQLQPDILVDNRADLMDYQGGWDFLTPEQYKVPAWPEIDGEKVPWETCQTFSGSWGYYRDEQTWKDNRQLLGLLIESVSKGGNLLLNVGPTARGTFDHRAVSALAGMGEWMEVNNRSIYQCTQAPDEFEAPDNTLLTYNPETRRLYVHLLEYPLNQVRLPGYNGKVKYAQFLHDASELQFANPRGDDEAGDDIILRLPVIKPPVEIPVIELMLY